MEKKQNELYQYLQETQEAILYNKNSGKFEYIDHSKVKDILKPMRTYLPFKSVIGLQFPFLIGTEISLDKKI